MTHALDRPFETCDHCGASFDRDTEYPVATRLENGGLELYSFCDTDCLDGWQSGRGAPDG